MLEETVLLKGRDGVTIRAVFTRGDSNNAVVYLPFFMGSHRNATPHRIAQTLPLHRSRPWVITIDFYAALEGYRSLSAPGATLGVHVNDLDTVLTYFREKVGLTGEIHLIGHSLGAFVAIMAGANRGLGLASVILLDGSDPALVKKNFAKLYGLERYTGEPLPGAAKELRISAYGSGMVMSASYLRSIEEFSLDYYTSGWNTPTLVVAAGAANVDLTDAAHAYCERLLPSKLEIIEGADHFFVGNPDWFGRLVVVVGRWIQGGYLTA